jgi:penicillin-binding protein 2
VAQIGGAGLKAMSSKFRANFGYPADNMPARGRLRVRRDAGGHEGWAEAALTADQEAGRVELEFNRTPVWYLAAALLMVMGILVVKLFGLQIIEGGRNLGLAEGNRIRQKVARAPRGLIYDRNRQVLASNVASFEVTVTPSQLPSAPAARQAEYAKLSAIIGRPASEIAAAAEAPEVNRLQAQLVLAGLERDRALLLDQKLAELPGFSLDVNPVRDYQDGGLLAHILGYTGRVSREDLARDDSYLPTDFTGKLGIERQYEQLLRGVNGSEQIEVDAQGNPVKVLASKPSLAGSSVMLAIDRDLERELAQNITQQMQKSGSTQAAGVAMNPKTGEVLAAVSLPTYDHNLFSRGIKAADYDRLVADRAQPLFNKAVSGVYPTGSIIKPLVALAALEERVVTPQTVIVDEGKLEVVNPYNRDVKYTFYGWEHSGLGAMTLTRAIAMSSDIYFYTVAGGFGNIAGLGVEKLTGYYQRFGLGGRTGIDLPDESAGRVPTPDWKLKTSGETWYTGDTYNIAVGQGDILASPLQMATAISAIANGGTVYRPRLVKAAVDETGQVVKEYPPVVARKLGVSAANLAVVREGMRQTMTGGTGCCSTEKLVPVPVAGKTGTAETDTSRRHNPHGWFEAFAPFDDPQIVIVVFIANIPGEGAEFALPPVRDTLAWYFKHRH